MEIDFFYVKLLLVPFLAALLGGIAKCCCIWCHRRRAVARELQHCATPIYVIPIPANGDTDSLSSVAQIAPPAYDSIIPVIPPPPYSEQQKTSCPDEEPPVYAEVAEEPSFIHISSPETTDT
ncbi:uncharacterized protein Hap1MRO34_016568 isoform 2-T3 [Clarias gariepinus]